MTGQTATPPNILTTIIRLSVMMFMQYFLMGAWFVTLGPFMNSLKMSNTDITWAYAMAQVAAIVAPVFLGVIADRYFASQIVTGLLHLIGGAILLAAPTIAKSFGENATGLTLVVLAHMMCFQPTIATTNTIAFNALSNPEKQFPLVRVWGTIGWIVVGFLVNYLMKGDSGNPIFFYVGGASGIALGLYSFSLPHTPPPQKGRPFSLGSAFGLETLALLKNRSFLIFMFSSMLICIPLAAYYSTAGNYAGLVGFKDVPRTMTFGQMSEILFMVLMPFCFARLGIKWMLAIGMLAWVLRYGFFSAAWDGASGNHVMWMVLTGIILHGICYDFFFVSGMIYTEQIAPKHIRAQAQGFLVLMTLGVGMLIGNLVFGPLADHYTSTVLQDAKEVRVTDWKTVWAFPAGFAFAVLVLFMVLFKQSKPSEQPA